MLIEMPETPLQQQPSLPELMTVAEAAEYLRVSIDTVRRWCRTGELRCMNLGDRAGYRIRREALVEFLEKRDNAKD